MLEPFLKSLTDSGKAGVSENADRRPNRTGVCQFWNCERRVREGHYLCREHYYGHEDGLIDKCPKCGQFKDADYELCLPCQRESERSSTLPKRVSERKAAQKPRVESSSSWSTKRDAATGEFFVYILRIDPGDFYIGHTRELRERLSEHEDGREEATEGRNPRLVYFEVHPSRDDAAKREAQLKSVKKANERQIRRMVFKFQDWIRLVQASE